MNKSQLQKSLGFHVRFRPEAIDRTRTPRDDDWILKAVEDDLVELVNARTNDVVRMAYDSIISFHREPDRDTDTGKYGFLSLSVQVHAPGTGRARIEPLPFARGGHGAQPPVTIITHQVSGGRDESSEWRDAAENFGRITGEIEGVYEVYDSGEVIWNVLPEDRSTSRDVEWFLAEARAAGRLLAKYSYVKGKFILQEPVDEADRWLNVVVGLVNPLSRISGDGCDQRGHHDAFFISHLVDASRVTCIRIASEVIPNSRSKIATALRELHRQVVHDILNVEAPTDHTLRDGLQKEWIPKAQAWDANVIKTMNDLGCDPSEIHFVETFALGELRTIQFLYPMNSQWTICDQRRERLEKVIDGYLDKPIFTR